ncbi:C40 family peptidase [Modestobacter sp. NPDC049651]|uniref:C40 family peptidase n=1 Tax=unclassified Modestobacter TaxID=2643866 RepID=UPI003409E812
MNRTTTRRWTRCAALAAGATVLAAFAPATAQAAPASTDQARQSVTETGKQLEAINEQVNQAIATVTEQQTAAQSADQAAAGAEAQLATLAPQLRAIAQAGYGGGTSSRVAAFLTSGSARDLVEQMSTLDQLAAHTDQVVGRIAAARDAAEQAKTAAATAEQQAEAAAADLKAKQAELKKQLSGYQSDLARLTAADQAKVQTALSGPQLTTATPAPAPTAAAGKAVQVALAQTGDLYVSGASGPDQFDCSGLTMYAYAAAGISLPHSSLAQSRMGTPVARQDLQPGDLVFYYKPVSHVGIYIGNGQMVHAPVPGQRVLVTSVDKGGYVGARRVALG